MGSEKAGVQQNRSLYSRTPQSEQLSGNSCLYLCFVGAGSSLTVCKENTLWKVMRSYRIPSKVMRIVQAMYTNCTCVVGDSKGRTDWFELKSRVQQHCNMSGFLFLLLMNQVMRRTVDHEGTGIRWKMMPTTEALDFVDDLMLTSSTFTQIQRNINHLNGSRKGMGLKISTKKTKLTRINANSTKLMQRQFKSNSCARSGQLRLNRGKNNQAQRG